jgi:O-antigen ligase
MAVACLFCFAHDARSSGMLFFVGAGIIWIMGRGIRITRQKLFAILIVGAVVFETAYVFYVNAVLSNEIGGGHSSAQLKRLDNPYNPFELLMTGRGETFAAITAISDKPLFGHGSWAKDKDLKYYKIVLSYQDEEAFDLKKADSVDRYIPSHSILMGGWISCGLGGFIAVFLIFWYLCKMGFTLVLKGQDLPLYPLYVMLTITMVWTFLFSPFQHLRFTIPVVGCILMNGYYDWLYGPNTDEAEEDGEPADVEEEHVMLN